MAFDARDIRPRLFLVLANRLYKSRLVVVLHLGWFSNYHIPSALDRSNTVYDAIY